MELTIEMDDGRAEAWVARPRSAAGDVPGVLLFMDAIGLRPQIRRMADRIERTTALVAAAHRR